ncbi:hypothetical protein OTK49_00565 [Vibrio coralliirubri]|uniref:hypothetical protein n=1 Tax=Vibrio coralliirubri TaxID=1516159 RepID=UPI0022847B1A|nr:hypothetical protein [Vibrio coralliirubri]MCY9861034.1 hypothetical protein [Vibrio coralliirubri]
MKSLIAITVAIAVGTPAFAAQENKIPAVGVLAHTVLSQAEIAKIKNFEIVKALSIEKAKSALDATSLKLTSINENSKEKLDTYLDSSEPIKTRIQKTYAVSDLLSDGILWATEVITLTKNHKYINEITPQIDDLNAQISKAKSLKSTAEKQINQLAIEAQRDRQIEIDTNILENKRLLDARDGELKSIIENKLLLGNFEINLYYLTAETKPQKDDAELIAKIFNSVAEIPDVKIDIIGRADPRGNLKYNEKLAKGRAEFISELATNAGFINENIKQTSFVSGGKIHKNRELHFFDRNTTVTIYKK